MKTKLLLALTLIFAVVQLTAQTSIPISGSGTSCSPYQIATLDNLYWLIQKSASCSKYFSQTADIDATSASYQPSGTV
ncbi:MAG: hypothetical protein WCP85_28935 [Mariniphaga sp.]